MPMQLACLAVFAVVVAAIPNEPDQLVLSSVAMKPYEHNLTVLAEAQQAYVAWENDVITKHLPQVPASWQMFAGRQWDHMGSTKQEADLNSYIGRQLDVDSLFVEANRYNHNLWPASAHYFTNEILRQFLSNNASVDDSRALYAIRDNVTRVNNLDKADDMTMLAHYLLYRSYVYKYLPRMQLQEPAKFIAWVEECRKANDGSQGVPDEHGNYPQGDTRTIYKGDAIELVSGNRAITPTMAFRSVAKFDLLPFTWLDFRALDKIRDYVVGDYHRRDHSTPQYFPRTGPKVKYRMVSIVMSCDYSSKQRWSNDSVQDLWGQRIGPQMLRRYVKAI